MSGRRDVTRVYLEIGPRKVFACGLDWPGWCRIGRSDEQALETLMHYAPRYRVVAERAGLDFEPGEPEVIERVAGSATTDFGTPGAVPDADAEPLDPSGAERQLALVRAVWSLFDEVAAASPAELRKGPRGGGRDRDKMIAHVIDAERAYARKFGVRHRPFAVDDRAALAAMRDDIATALGAASDGTPLTAGGWPSRYAARRVAWHALDHLWELEDRRI